MTKKMESSGNSGVNEKQVDLDGKRVGSTESLGGRDREELGIWKSVLQKAVRRGMTEKAMFAAYRLVSLNWWSCWKRLSVIADEDVGQPEAITTVDVLYRKFMALKKESKKGELSWDMKRCAICAAKILAEAPKDRRADEFLELLDAMEKHGKDEELRKEKQELEAIPDEALDMHTLQGRRMGRGDLYWYEVSSDTVNKTSEYEAWRNWFNPLMVRLVKERKK
jgi:replication-associated recombination protein RarA